MNKQNYRKLQSIRNDIIKMEKQSKGSKKIMLINCASIF